MPVLSFAINGGLPVTTPKEPVVTNKLTLIPLIFMIYFEVAGGSFGLEPAVKAVGPLFSILGFFIFPFIWSIPEALVTAELATALPGNGGYIIWAYVAFGPNWGPFFGSTLGALKYLTSVINMSSFPVLGVEYLQVVFPILEDGWPRITTVLGIILVLSLVTFFGLDKVAYIAIGLGVLSLAPFIIMSLWAAKDIKPERWLVMGQKGVQPDWNLFLNTLFWNLNFWDTVSTMAGEVENPKKTFPKALLYAVILTCFGYIIPLMAATGALELDQNAWESGYMAVVAGEICGKWLKILMDIAAVGSVTGLFLALISSCSFQILGMAEFGFLPKFFEVRSRFQTPWIGILVSSLICMGCSFMPFTRIISVANLLYSVSMVLEFLAFIMLRVKFPTLKRPYRVPVDKVWLLALWLCIPTAFLVVLGVITIRASMLVTLISGVLTLGAGLWFFLMMFIKKMRWLEFRNAEDVQIGEEEEE